MTDKSSGHSVTREEENKLRVTSYGLRVQERRSYDGKRQIKELECLKV